MRGLSPRGRGKPYPPNHLALLVRSIPAWAGETSSLSTALPALPVYPRVGGGNAMLDGVFGHQQGLSPRGRGKPFAFTPVGAVIGSIPAWAGETGTPNWRLRQRRVYPRVGGGNV